MGEFPFEDGLNFSAWHSSSDHISILEPLTRHQTFTCGTRYSLFRRLTNEKRILLEYPE